MSTWNVTEADRDGQGQIALDAPRKLADLLPGVERPKAQHTRPLSGRQVGALVGGTLVLIAALVALLAQPAPAASVPGPTVAPTSPPAQPSATLAPTPFGAPLDSAVVAYFSYQDLGSATALEPGRRVQPIARIGQEWVLLELEDGTRVWVRWGELPAPTLEQLPDLATPEPPTAAPATAAPAAPAVAPAAPAPCDEYTAPYRIERQVEVNGIPIGKVTAWSCESAADAEQQAAAQEAQLRATDEAGR